MEHAFTVTRIFNAPRHLVWQAWTKPEYLAEWWGPHGWTLARNQMDFREGGAWQYCMKGAEGEESCGRSVYKEIVEPERIVYMDYFTDANGNVVEGMPAAQVTVEFIDQGGKTKVVNTSVYPTAEDRDRVIQMGMEQGMKETWDRLEALIPTL